MLIESSSTRLSIDLLESLRMHKLYATDIRVSYINKTGGLSFTTFSSLDEIKKLYKRNFERTVMSRRNPFTIDKRKAQQSPIIENGLIIGIQQQPVNSNKVKGLCELGRFVSIERFKLKSSSFNYDIEYTCTDVSDIFKITEGRKRDIRRNSNRDEDVKRHKNAIKGFINTYQKILRRLNDAYNANLYVDLCYVNMGYVEDSILLYSIFFALVKERIDSGLRLSVLEPRYLKKTEQ
tara:strand:+ start:3694 stop:4401 length:708 start_codon:yes stop_codon:yes gene_type:complete